MAIIPLAFTEKQGSTARNLVLKYSVSGKESKKDIVRIYSQTAVDEKKLIVLLMKQIEVSMNGC